MPPIVQTSNPLITAPFDDVDEPTYGDLPIAKELEVRVANVVPGAGALVELRSSISQLVEAERVGEKMDELQVSTGWTPGGSTALSTPADAPAGYSGNSLQLAITALANNTITDTEKAYVRNLGEYAGGAPVRVWCKASSLTNLDYVRVRYEFATSSDFAEFNCKPTAGATWQEFSAVLKGAPTATGGTIDWSNVKELHLRIRATGGIYTGNVLFRDWRLGTLLTLESSYDTRVRWRDNASPTTWGPWSSWYTFKVSAPPTATLTSPAEAGTITDATPTLDWAFASPGGKTQTAYRVRVYDNATGVQVYDSGRVESATSSADVPPFLLDQATTYRWDVEVEDTDALAGTMAPATFVTSFSLPPDATGLVATPNPGTSGVELTWDPSSQAAGHFVRWALYRQDEPTAFFVLVAYIYDEGTTSYTDYGAPLGIPVTWRVTEWNGSAEGGASEAVATLHTILPGAWALVAGGEPTYTLELLDVTAGPRTYAVPQEAYMALDRSVPLVETGRAQGAQGSLSFRTDPATRQLLQRVREMANLEGNTLVKTRYGEVFEARLGTVNATPQPWGLEEVTVTYQEVVWPPSVTFDPEAYNAFDLDVFDEGAFA